MDTQKSKIREEASFEGNAHGNDVAKFNHFKSHVNSLSFLRL